MSAIDRRAFLTTTAAAGLAVLPARHGLTSPADDDPLGVRADFPVTQEQTYLNTASVGPMSKTVRDAVAAYADEKMLQRNPEFLLLFAVVPVVGIPAARFIASGNDLGQF